MRQPSSLVSRPAPSDRVAVTDRRSDGDKSVTETKPAPKKRSLNEAAHKLER